ncbi:MAG: redoxin domain-containing protein [Sphingobacteriaceae bacterium]|nr:redoxin domain-containing protein [Sphingobacteriaceae bacterium]
MEGKFVNYSGLKKVEFYKGAQLIDSAILNEKGEFEFKEVSPDEAFFTIVAAQQSYTILAKNGDEIVFSADFSDMPGKFKVEGSESSERLLEFNQISSKYSKIYQDIQKEFQDKVGQHPSLKDSLEGVLIPRFEKNIEAFANETIAFAEKNNDNLAGFYAIGSLDQARYEEELVKYAENIKGKFSDNPPVQEFLKKMERLKALSVGKVAPDFQMASTDGQIFKLSQFRGQYVLLDFWASWCGPCREENPNLVKQFNAFKNKGFTILGVSLDNNKDQWLKAISADKLTWTHVSELKQWDSNIVKQYNLEAIPTSYLLDKEGKIIAKNLRGAELEQFLTKTLK